ncbi:hypothetical protein LXL04_005832 [Taraxacum kok-saghyz]
MSAVRERQRQGEKNNGISMAKALVHLENENQDLESDLKDIYFNSSTQIDVSENCKALVIRYPHKFRERFHKIYLKLVTQLKKMFRVDAVFLIARIRRSRPRFQLDVHIAMLEDIVYPAKILGALLETDDKLRTISMKVYLDHEERNDTDYMLLRVAAMGRSIAERARIRAPSDPERFRDWSEQIKPDQKLEMAVVSGHGFHISKIELETVVVENRKEANEVPVIVTFDGYKCVIGTLSESATEIFFDIEIHAERFQFYHEWKERSVKISGYYYDKPDFTQGCAYVDEEEEKEDMKNEVSFVECVHSDYEDDVYENEYMETDEEDDSMVDSSADNEEEDVDEEKEDRSPEIRGPDKKAKIQH